MKKLIAYSLLLFSLLSTLSSKAQGVGQWKAYMSYHNITAIEPAGKLIYVLASNNLFSYNFSDSSIDTYDKVNKLSDCGIIDIKWNNTAKRLIIIYDNYNIDLIDNNAKVYNISDYYTKSMTSDKTINSTYINDIYAYLSTGFGIVKVNMKDAEVSDTYQIGINVKYCYIEGKNIYAASETSGLYAAKLTDNLLDHNVWKRVGEYTPKTENRTLVADDTNNCMWTVDENGKLLAYTEKDGTKTNIRSEIRPEGPKYNHFFFMKYVDGSLYTTGGGEANVTFLQRPGTIQVMSNGEWTLYEDEINKKTGHIYEDISCLDIDPLDKTHVFAASSRSGVYEFRNGKFIKNWTFDNTNSCITTVIPNNYDYVIVNGLKFDSDGNLWVLNSWSEKPIAHYSKEGNWTEKKNQAISNISKDFASARSPIFDSRGLFWFTNDAWSSTALLCLNPADLHANVYTDFTNQDGTVVGAHSVRCVVEDKSKNIWIGTIEGPLMLTAEDIAAGNKTFTQVKVPRNDGTDYADYLLSGVDIACIAIDGGGRKWFGTYGDGAYLISEDNNTQIHHFTQSNSSLLSNTIEAITINDKTGEVFFGTDKGLCSYMSDASTPNSDMSKDNVWAYPNPVTPDYTGLITVTGLSYNADVKIVTVNGTLVAQGRSNGGTFTWDGNDLSGRRVASGIYMVETAKSDGSKGTVCKIAIVN